MEQIWISCIALSYNGGDKILQTLESFKNQSYQYKDLVVADDASTDDGYTVSIIENWISNNHHYFQGVQFIKNPQNLGIVKNMRNASLHAKGDIVFGLGQGDLCYDNKSFNILSNEINKQRNNGINDPYFWLCEYDAFQIKNTEQVIVKLNKDLPHQHLLIANNPIKALKVNLRRWEIGGIAMIYNKKFYKKEIYPLFEAPKNWEDGPSFLWALAGEKKIGIIPYKLRLYEIGTGISWQSSKSKNNDIRSSFTKIGAIMLNKKRTMPVFLEEYLNWINTLSPQDKQIRKILDTYINMIRNTYGLESTLSNTKYFYIKLLDKINIVLRYFYIIIAKK